MTLFDSIAINGDSRRTRFEAFHAGNPEVYRLFRSFAHEAIQAGRLRFSGRSIIHRIRWETSLKTRDPQGLKVNDHWSPFYVRLFEAEYPEYVGFFEKRHAIADRGRAS